MKFQLSEAISVLENTPNVLREMLGGLSSNWTHVNEGEETWSPYDIVGHLIHGEKTDWIPRLNIILNTSEEKRFEPFDRFAQFEQSVGKTLVQLLTEFETLRADNIKQLEALSLSDSQLNATGIHPEFGSVTLSELLSAWVVHDLGHIAQISRVMAKQYKKAAGPWPKYLSILNS